MPRLAPSQEHLDYLQRVGVDILAVKTPLAPGSPADAAETPAVIAARPPAHHATPRHPGRAWTSWPTSTKLLYILLVVAVLVAAGVIVWALTSGTADAAEPTATPIPGILPAGSYRDVFVHGKREMKASNTTPEEARPTTASTPEAPRRETAPASDPKDEKPEAAPAAPPSPDTRKSESPRRGEPHPAPQPASPRPWSLEALGVFALVALAGTTLFCQGHLDARVHRVEVTLFGDEPRKKRKRDDSEPRTADAPAGFTDPPDLFTADSPARALEALVAAASARGLSPLPRAPKGSWGAGIASIPGNVRPENQDAAIAFEMGTTQVIVVADGLGGLPRGQEAARLAVGHAALSAASSLATPKAASLPQLVAARALLDAAAALSGRALAAGYGTGRDGFRTTLIVIVATPTTYGYAYLGDGGGIVLRASGAAEAFLVPQKSDGLANVVAGSLGPILQGSPAAGLLDRRPGDVLLVGTDGVFDRVPDTFAATVSQALHANGGDAQRVAALAVADLAAAVDGTGYICDDNLSFAILCTPAPSAVASGRRRASAGRG